MANRLFLFEVTARTLHRGTALLGIPTPEWLCAPSETHAGPSPCRRGRGRASVRSSVGSAEMRERVGDIIRECVLGAFSGDPCEGKVVAAVAGVQVLLQRLDRVGSDDSVDGIVVEPLGVQNVCAAFQLLVPSCPSITPGA